MRWGIAHPSGNDVDRMPLGQFRLAGCAQIVEQAGPWGQAGSGDDSLKLRPHIAVPPSARTFGRLSIRAIGDNIFRSLRGHLKGFDEIRKQFGEQRKRT